MYFVVLGLIVIFIFDIVKALYLRKQTILKRVGLILTLVILVIPLMDLPYFFKGGISEQVQFEQMLGADSGKSIITIYKDIDDKLYWSDGIDRVMMYSRKMNEDFTIKYLPITRLILKVEQGQSILYDHTNGSVVYILAFIGYLLFREIAKGTFFKLFSNQ